MISILLRAQSTSKRGVLTHIFKSTPRQVTLAQGIMSELTIIPLALVGYLQVNALGEWIIGIYLHEFTNNEREILIPHEAAECGIEKFRVHC